jgi:hypothetical protein
MQPDLEKTLLVKNHIKPKDATLEIFTKSIEQSLRVEGYVVSPDTIKSKLIAHFERK